MIPPRPPAPPSRVGAALVVGKFAPLHAGHQHLIETALAEADAVTVLVYAVPDFAAMPSAMRAGWVRHLYPACRVLTPEGAPPDAAPDAAHRAFLKAWLARQAIAVDAVYTSEAYGDPLAAHLGLVHRAVDPGRARVPISATLLRADPRLLARHVHPLVRADLVGDGWHRRADTEPPRRRDGTVAVNPPAPASRGGDGG